jgi:hypothetical protein
MDKNHVEILNQLAKKLGKNDASERALVAEISAFRHCAIPYWHLIALQGLCKQFDVLGMEDFKAPNELSGIKVFYAASSKEVTELVDPKVAYSNKYNSSDEMFVQTMAAVHKKVNGKMPQFAVMFHSYLYFSDVDLIAIVNEDTETENQVENSDELPID